MKTITLLTLLTLFMTLDAVSQQYGWSVIARPRPGYQIHAVEFKDSLHGYCTAGDRIYTTADGGHIWQAVTQPSFPNAFSDISFSDTSHGWVVGTFYGDDALIWKTIDAGRSWMEVLYQTPRQYRSIAAIDIGKIFTAGSIGIIPDTGKMVQSSNSGATWTESTLADSITYLGKMQFVDSLHGWMAGSVRAPAGYFGTRNVFFRSADGGMSWLLIDLPISRFSFVDSLNGFAPGRSDFVNGEEGFYFLKT